MGLWAGLGGHQRDFLHRAHGAVSELGAAGDDYYVFWANKGGVASYHPPQNDAWGGFLAMLAIVIGFFATAGAAGADFGTNNRNRRDVVWAG